ncbi:hypothetical protein AArcSl_0840 [Halalkaliarchaeum desulfuricum]|uniref:DUF58 domain-containing protein n=1 Tax=Halalkaliarchaeum desulfuricum TaxID=2055893 RepID=A0A343THB1_9EURY|nr:DUF58 domain-containing protein [Halalkaliarchaeum desulfuricum]AUX08483.1 hypothetical protein AArcSl_0840 [Halalkaliarchaeum desulfuricum]
MLPDRFTPDVRLTRRGKSVVAVCLFAAAMAWIAGPRALNAVVAPGIVGLAAAYLQLRGLEAPRVIRDLPPDAHAGTSHELRLRFADAGEPTAGLSDPFLARVTERVDDGLELEQSAVEAAIGESDVQFEVSYRRRGERSIGPTELVATDVFGLLSREFDCDPVDSVLVYPERRPIPKWFRLGLYDVEEVGKSRQRDEFDQLREYVEGDSLRDIHWPATARKDELIVKEFAADTQGPSVSISVGGRGADRTAMAATSVALALLEEGVPVDLSAPNGRVETFPGGDPRQLLELLTRLPRGGVPDPDADVVIEGTHRQTEIKTDGETHRFDQLREGTAPGQDDDRSQGTAEGQTGEPAPGTVPAADGGER